VGSVFGAKLSKCAAPPRRGKRYHQGRSCLLDKEH
jgi:hypothetical protein